MPDNIEILKCLEFGIRDIVTTCCPEDVSMIEADPAVPVHRHQRREFIFVVEGEYDLVIDNHFYHLTPGSLAFIDSWQPHSFWYLGTERNMVHLWGHIKPKQIKVSMTALNAAGKLQYPTVGHVNGPPSLQLNYRCSKLRQMAPVNREMKELLLRKAFEVIFEELKLNLIVMPPVGNKQKLVEVMSDYIRENLGRNCSLKQLEKVSGYSQYYISHVFREIAGLPIGEFIDEVRMEYILKASRDGRNAKELANDLGFASYGSFWKWRKKHRNREAG